MKVLLYALCTIGLVGGLVPPLAMLWAARFARRHGCTVDSTGPQPCLVNGTDWGETLYSAMMMGWFSMLSVPIAVASLIGLIVLVLRSGPA